MIELIILFILQKKNSNIYEIRRYIEKNFSIFYKVSLGTVHPALKRLLDKEYVELEKSITEGGQRKSTYKLTEKGLEYFHKLLEEELPENPSIANQLIDFKFFFLSTSQFPEKTTETCIANIIKYLEIKKVKYENSLKDLQENNKFYKYTELSIKSIADKLKFAERL